MHAERPGTMLDKGMRELVSIHYYHLCTHACRRKQQFHVFVFAHTCEAPLLHFLCLPGSLHSAPAIMSLFLKKAHTHLSHICHSCCYHVPSDAHVAGYVINVLLLLW